MQAILLFLEKSVAVVAAVAALRESRFPQGERNRANSHTIDSYARARLHIVSRIASWQMFAREQKGNSRWGDLRFITPTARRTLF